MKLAEMETILLHGILLLVDEMPQAKSYNQENLLPR